MYYSHFHFVLLVFRINDPNGVWIGLRRDAYNFTTDLTWAWTDNSTVDWLSFDSAEPDLIRTKPACVKLMRPGVANWTDEPCVWGDVDLRNNYSFVCKKGKQKSLVLQSN